MVLLLAPLFDLGVDFKVFVDNIMTLLRPWLQKVIILNLEKKEVLPVAPLFETGVDFGVFDQKIKVFKTRVLVLRS
jgi:hypothetical protein